MVPIRYDNGLKLNITPPMPSKTPITTMRSEKKSNKSVKNAHISQREKEINQFRKMASLTADDWE